jgi:hypothetical protein
VPPVACSAGRGWPSLAYTLAPLFVQFASEEPSLEKSYVALALLWFVALGLP